jgi:cytochrome c oxidase assembly factor CtaG
LPWLHFLEHASFFLTAWLFWRVFVDLTGRVRTDGSAKFGTGIFMAFSIMLISG